MNGSIRCRRCGYDLRASDAALTAGLAAGLVPRVKPRPMPPPRPSRRRLRRLAGVYAVAALFVDAVAVIMAATALPAGGARLSFAGVPEAARPPLACGGGAALAAMVVSACWALLMLQRLADHVAAERRAAARPS